ncbi:MAG: glycosyltransferase family 9 protein [Pirellulaceae bacterium]
MIGRTGPRFLINRLSHIGDCLLTLPLAAELRQQFPDCLIVWACEPASQSLLRLHSAIDEVVVVPPKWFKRWRDLRAIRRQLREFKFDISIDPQGLFKSSLVGLLSGAPRRLGFRGEHGRELSSWMNNRLVRPTTSHLVDRTLELLTLLPLPTRPGPANLNLPIAPAAAGEIAAFVSGLSLDYVVINPGASWPSKQWDTARFGELARQVRKHFGLIPVVSWGGAAESKMADHVVAVSQGAAVKAPSTTLLTLAALLSRAKIFIGCDTGPLHLAVASGTRCIGLYGPTRPQDSGAYGAQHLAIQKTYQSGTRRERRFGTNWAMLEISIDDVLAAVETMLRDDSHLRHSGAA